MKKVVAYCRVSTDHDDQKNSLENQRLYFEDYVKQHRDWKLVGIYADEGISGTSLKKRDEFNRMYRNGFRKEYDIILTKEVCRFARNTVDTLEKTRELKKVGIEVRFIIDNISTFDTDGELRLTIMAGLAQDESRRISERVQFGVIQSMKKGVAFGNIVYGYDFKDGKLYVNEEEAKVVKMIFHKYLVEGKGAYTIANELKSAGIKVKRTGTTNWRTGSVLDILKNVKYAGDLKQRITYTIDYLEHTKRFNKGEVDFIVIKNNHEPIIDRETFDATQRELERRSKIHSHEKSKYSCRHTLSGKLVCAECGGKYVGGVSRERADGTRRRSWRCATAVNYGKKHIVNEEEIGCNNNRVNDLVIKETFNTLLKEIITNKKEIKKDVETALKGVLTTCRTEINEIDSLIKSRERVERERSRLLDLCLKEIITDDEYKNKSIELNEKIGEYDEQIKEQEEKKKVRENIDEILENVRNIVDKILSLKKFSKNICKDLLDKVVVYNNSKFDFYLKGYEDPFIFNNKGNILYAQH